MPLRGERLPLHDRGKVLVQMALVLAGGGESCLDIEHLRAQEDLFGSVPSDSTVWRAFHELSSTTLEHLERAVASVRNTVWRRSSKTTGVVPVVLDIDASLVEVHTDTKEGTGPTYGERRPVVGPPHPRLRVEVVDSAPRSGSQLGSRWGRSS